MKHIYILYFILASTTFCLGQDINIGIRDTVFSTVLDQGRELAVYLPPSYYSTPDQKYPVLYILDGDYNFQYVAGILELEGGISERIPEMILVAISGKGTNTYRRNCKPNLEGVEDKGNADKVVEFIAKELIPYVNSKYRTEDFKILSGHSLGGLFVTNTALNDPKLFDRYIAISPALWWAGNAIDRVAKQKVNDKGYKTKLYVSLANEQGMGVDSFLGAATSSFLKKSTTVYGIAILFIVFAIGWGFMRKKVLFPILLGLIGIGISGYLIFCYYPQSEDFKFRKFTNENHNSVGEPTYRWALEDIFKKWRVNKDYFDSAEGLKSHYEMVKSTYGSTFNIPYTTLGNTFYMVRNNPEELSKIESTLKTNYKSGFETFNIYRAGRILEEQPTASEELINEVLVINPKSSESYHLLAKIRLIDNNTKMADSLISKAIQLANSQKQRQWKINELTETKKEITEKE